MISYNIISYRFHIISRVGIVIYRGCQISSIEKREIVVLANYYGFYKFFSFRVIQSDIRREIKLKKVFVTNKKNDEYFC